MAISFKIHPGIGVARVGNSTEFFVGPETLEIPAVPAGGYRDADEKFRRQAARFRVFRYDDSSSDPPREVTGDSAYSFAWTVTLWKKPPSTGSDPPLVNTGNIAGTGSVASLPPISYPSPSGSSYSFADLKTEPEGRLLVLSTRHFSEGSTSASSANFDGSCDGKVEVSVSGPDGAGIPALSSWVLICAPDFAPGRQAPRSFYDVLYQFYVDQGLFMSPAGPIPSAPVPSFRKDIFPVLRAKNRGRPLPASIESNFPGLGDEDERSAVASSPSPPDAPGYWPLPPLTSVQQEMLDKWVAGDYLADWPPALPLALTPEELDRGAIRHLGDFGYGGPGVASASAISLHTEAFRLSATGPLLLPSYNWIGDIPVCGWAADTERPSPTSPVLWTNRGFTILDGDDLTYVEASSGPYVLLLTQVLDFGRVQEGPPPSPGTKSLPVVFEIRTGDAPVSVVITSIPSGLSSVAVPPVPASTTSTVNVWVTYHTGTTAPGPESHIVVAVDGNDYVIPVVGMTVPFEGTKLALALDCSYSMTELTGPGLSKMDALKQALVVLLEVARAGDGVGFASFSNDVIGTQDVLLLGPPGDADADGLPDDPNRQTLAIFAQNLPLVSSTSIGDGLLAASNLLAAPTPGASYANGAIIVITDGKETAPAYIASVADRITRTTFALGIGTSTNVNFDTLQTLTGNRGGAILLTGDLTSGDNRYALEKNLIQILYGATNEEIILDPLGTIVPGAVHSLEIPITEAESSFKWTVVSDQSSELALALEAPDGSILSAETLDTLPGVVRRNGARVAYGEVQVPLTIAPGRLVHAGVWRLKLMSRGSVDAQFFAQDLTHRPSRPGATKGKPITYAAIVGARSAIRFRSRLGAKEGTFYVEANSSVFGAPPPGAMRVVADITGPGDLKVQLPLRAVEPGRYLGEFRPATLGDYQIRVRALGQAPSGHSFYRELQLSGAFQGDEASPWHPGDRGTGVEPGRAAARFSNLGRPSAIHETLACCLERWAEKLRKCCR